MGLTYAEAKACGVEHLHPDHPGNAGAAVANHPAVPDSSPVKLRPGSLKVNDKGQNKTEAAFDEWLDGYYRAGQIDGCEWEPFKLRIGPRTFLRIDFAVKRVGYGLALVDVKGGPWTDDAAVKMKVAAEKFQWLGTFWVVRRVRRQWEFRHVHPRTGLGETCVGKLWL